MSLIYTYTSVHDGLRLTFAIIPHTAQITTLGTSAVGDPVNLEVDVIAKYVERLLGEKYGSSSADAP